MAFVDEDEEKKRSVDKLYTKIANYRNYHDFSDLIRFVKKLKQYSPFNCLLIHVQKPGSSYVATEEIWQKRFKRSIKPDARPLVILQPGGPVNFVFDVSDTEGQDVPDEIINPFRFIGEFDPRKYDCLLDNLPRIGVRYGTQQLGSCAGAYIKVCDSSMVQKVTVLETKARIPTVKDIEVKYDIVANSNFTKEDNFPSIIHELGHLFCGHLGTFDKKFIPDRKGVSPKTREFEAEIVAHIVCERMRINNRSEKYLSGYLEKGEIPQINLECVLKASGKIENMLYEKAKIPKKLIK